MKKIIQVISLALCLCWLFILSGCTAGYASVEKRSTDLSRFIEVEHEHDRGWSVVYDAETKVMYSVSFSGEFTVLVDADGSPLLWKEY